MTPEQLKTILDASGIPFAYHHWAVEKRPPYGVYLYVYDSKFYADGVLYYSTEHCQVEVYTDKKDPGLEQRIEAVLASAGIGYDKSESYIESEKLFEILYEIEV